MNFESETYNGRNTIERSFSVFKQWRGIATRYDKLALTYRAGVVLYAVVIWLRQQGDTRFSPLSALGGAAGIGLSHVGGLMRSLPSLPRLWLITVLTLPRCDASRDATRVARSKGRKVVALTTVAQTRPFVIGVDSHARTRTYAIRHITLD